MIQESPQFRWQAWLLWSGVLLLVVGFVVERSWQSLPLPRTLETLILGAITLALAALLSRLLRSSIATALVALYAVALICFAGVLPVLATLLLIAGGFCLGCAVTGCRHAMSTTVAGIGMLAGALGWLLAFPLHYRLVYFLLLLLLCVAQRRHCLAAIRNGVTAWRAAVDETPGIAAFAVLVVALASAGCWLPTVQYDDLAYHLGLPSQLAALGYYRMDVHSQIWALAPWSGDIVQAIAQVLAGAEARGAIDAFWLLAAAALTWQLAAALQTPVFARWLSVALFASLPLTASLVGGMHAELPAAVASLALSLTVTTAAQTATFRDCLRFAVLAGFLLALKTGFIAIVLPLCIWLIWRWRGQWSWRLAVASVASSFVVCGSSYVYAAVLTGNPLFPLLNSVFHSVLFDAQNLIDWRWSAAVGWDIVWQLTFHTRAYLEGWNGAAGFSLLALSGAAIVALTFPGMRGLTTVGLVAFIAAIITVPYFRYTYPALLLLTPGAVAAFVAVTSRRNAMVLLISLTTLNLAYQSCSYWTLHVGGVKRRVMQWSDEPVKARLVPERALIQSVREQDMGANVLLCSPDAPFAAELAGHGFVTAWYDPELRAAREVAEADLSGAGWHALFARAGAGYAITAAAQSAALKVALSDAQLLRQVESVQLWKLPQRAGESDLNALFRQRDLAVTRLRP
jgi:ABC-type transport system involved in multi-copper enzyme maturation permease subunit